MPMPTWVLNIVLWLVRELIARVSPPLVEYLKEQVQVFASKAAKTPNPWDDILAKFLLIILDLAPGEPE